MLSIFRSDSKKAERGLDIVRTVNEKCEKGLESAIDLMGPSYAELATHATGSYNVGSDRDIDAVLERVAALREEIGQLKRPKGDISPERREKERELRENFREAIQQANKLLKRTEKKVPTKLSSLVDDVLDE